jgi:hypothetical protein
MDPHSSSLNFLQINEDRFSRKYLYGCHSPEQTFSDQYMNYTNELVKIKYNRILKIVERMFILCNNEITPFKGNNTAKLLSYLFTNKLEFVAGGVNSYRKTSPLQYSFFHDFREKAIFVHSEIQCLKNSLRNKGHRDNILNGRGKYMMIIVRSKKNSRGIPVYGVSLPCVGCRNALKKFNIKKVIYTLDQDDNSIRAKPGLGALILRGNGYVNFNLSQWYEQFHNMREKICA